MRKYITQEFIEKAQQIHGNKYDYSKVKYIHSQIKLIIICPKHGEFEQEPASHLRGSGCYKCWLIRNKSNINKFIQKAREIHSNKYDYSKVQYIDSKTKITIICPEHGEFNQQPYNHLNGVGCLKCGYKRNTLLFRNTNEDFIQKANMKHNNKYDYSKINYITNKNKITIICSEHGEFEQKPNSHLNGNGCPECKKINIGNICRSNKEEFIQKAQQVHNDRYDYSKVLYVSNKSKVIIICKKKNHGEFEQTPNSHLKGDGCPKCKMSRGEIALEEIFNKYKIINEHQYRIPEVANELYYDFYLPEYRLLIEFHGKQHYEYIPFFHDGDFTFTDQRDRDNYIRHNARSFRYNYLEFNYKQLKKLSKEQFEEFVISKIMKYN